jgi:hypothetical protein
MSQHKQHSHQPIEDIDEQESSSGKTVAIVFLVLIIIVAALAVFLMFSSRLKVLNELNDTQNQLQVSRDVNAQLQNQIDTLKTANSNAQYIIMPELGVRIAKTTDLQNVVTGTEVAASPTQPFAHFTSAEIMTGVMSNPAGPYSPNQCGLSDSPLGVITRYKPGSVVFGKVVDSIVDANVKKLGNYYYVYTNNASQCTSNRTVIAIITPQQQAFAAAFASIELVPGSSVK